MLPPKFCRQFEKSTTLKDFLDFTEVWFLVCCVPRMEPYSGQYMRLSSIKQLELWEANKQQYFYFTFLFFPFLSLTLPLHQSVSYVTFLATSSKLVTAFVTYPLQLVKTCIQTEIGFKALGPTCKRVYSLNGVRGFYSGFLLHVLRSTPSSVLTILIAEQISKFILTQYY